MANKDLRFYKNNSPEFMVKGICDPSSRRFIEEDL